MGSIILFTLTKKSIFFELKLSFLFAEIYRSISPPFLESSTREPKRYNFPSQKSLENSFSVHLFGAQTVSFLKFLFQVTKIINIFCIYIIII